MSATLSAEIVRRGSSTLTHGAETVAVSGESLVHTAQILATDSGGDIVGGGDAVAQTRQVLDNLQSALAASGSRISGAVKLNLYLRPGGDAATVLKAVSQRYPHDGRPAISLVETALPHPDALVAADAVAVQIETPSRAGVVHYGSRTIGAAESAQAALLPVGPRVYISGQAASDDDLRTATIRVLNLLRGNLAYLGLALSDTVQVKSFVKPMSSAASLAGYIAEYFEQKTPPLVFVEWSNAETLEIELIAAVSRSQDSSAEPLQYLTPPGDTASPVFCRIVRVDHQATIYFSGLYGQGSEGPDQIRSAFSRLGGAAARAGTDLRHLVKATYYVTSDEVGQQLTDIRKGLYDPGRPPAASKATVSATGARGSFFTMDMIAVPAPVVQ